MTGSPDTAMVLAAGHGKRLAPITDHTPKPLVEIAGRTLLDRGLDNLKAAGVSRLVVNVHHLGQQIIDHLAARTDFHITISDERDGLRDSAGAIVHALPALGEGPFFVLNADTFWIDPEGRDLTALARRFDPDEADMVLMLARQDNTTGHSGRGDFLIDAQSRLQRATGDAAAHAPIYAGAAVMMPDLFANAPETPHSLNLYFDRAIATRRLFGHVMASPWITVGTPDALAPAAQAVQRFADAARR